MLKDDFSLSDRLLSWHIQKYPNDIYCLLFNTKEKWESYHQFGDTEYIFGVGRQNEAIKKYQNRIQKIPKFLSKLENGIYLTSSSQCKDQIYFYFIPYQFTYLKEHEVICCSDDYKS